jgi:hypothetical protein
MRQRCRPKITFDDCAARTGVEAFSNVTGKSGGEALRTAWARGNEEDVGHWWLLGRIG